MTIKDLFEQEIAIFPGSTREDFEAAALKSYRTGETLAWVTSPRPGVYRVHDYNWHSESDGEEDITEDLVEWCGTVDLDPYDEDLHWLCPAPVKASEEA